ncbi:low density lipoprotein receptor adapter protein 1-like isoform X1 [Dermochelys coriacea]|uniref:low density lipoprotein receptor adapter protein 1-like isoform X1 n=1 Tax=Dermochelys coriacea TaxID=27794 RepID=UPI001CA8BEBE|nr:low density lipoprotein receptor adapter protein 1-like isoform X1 [Dermochelys coriacea]
MEALRAAGRAVLRSPRLARHGLGLCWHRKLPENWADMQEPLLEGIGFTLKYLGMTLVEKPKGEDMAANAIRRIIAMARVGAKKFQKVILTVSPRGISLQDAETKEMIECVSIYRISYCTTDKLQNKVFAYVAQSQQSGALECHAFLSPKKKIAQAVTLTVAQAFQVALDHWEAAQAGPPGSISVSFTLFQALDSPTLSVPWRATGQAAQVSQLRSPWGAPHSNTTLRRMRRRRKTMISMKPFLAALRQALKTQQTLCLPLQEAARPSCAYHRAGPHLACPQHSRMKWDGGTGGQAPTCHKGPSSKVSTG